MSYTKPHISDITSKIINDIDNVEEADNYIDWVTYEVKNDKNHPNYKQYTFSLENNNNVAAISQENIFTNENQNGNDILAASAGYVMNNQNNTNNILAASAGYGTYKTNNIVNKYYFPNQNNDIDKKLGELEATNKEIKEELNQYNKKIRSLEESINELNPLCDNVVDDYDIDINPQYYRPYDSSYEEEKAEVNKNTIYDEKQEQKKLENLIEEYKKLDVQWIDKETIQDNNKEPYDTVEVSEETVNTKKRIIHEAYIYIPYGPLQKANKRNSEYQNEGQDLLKLVEPRDNTMNEDESNIDNNNQFLSIKNVCEIKEKLKEKIKRYHTKTIEIRPHFININNKNEKTINIRDNHCIDITNNQ